MSRLKAGEFLVLVHLDSHRVTFEIKKISHNLLEKSAIKNIFIASS